MQVNCYVREIFFCCSEKKLHRFADRVLVFLRRGDAGFNEGEIF